MMMVMMMMMLRPSARLGPSAAKSAFGLHSIMKIIIIIMMMIMIIIMITTIMSL